MKRLLILFTNGFPYHTSEPFLETEYPLYSDYYDKVLIVASCRRNDRITRNVDDEHTEVIGDYTLSRDFLSIIEAIPFALTDRLFYRELVHLVFTEGFTLKKLYDLLAFSLCANHRAMKARRWIRKHPEYRADSLYAYWFHIPAYAALRLNAMLKKPCYCVSRAHGYDLYLQRHTTGYIPFHRRMYEKLDAVAVVSQQGKDYLQQQYGVSGKIGVYHLGAADHMLQNPPAARSTFRLVSCARSVSLKRLDRIVDALARITDVPVQWTHIGDGPIQQDLKKYAVKKLPGNVSAAFAGHVANEQVYAIYSQQPFHVFVNVSETEGMPVAIMEAMSFGIPVIATDVGGTAELIEAEKNGYLLCRDFSDEELERMLKKMIEMPEKAYLQMRKAARVKFEREYCANTNYRRFLNDLTGQSMCKNDHSD